jgi:hypothetical protein
MTGYDSTHAEGFIRLFGLPLATAARRGIVNAPDETIAIPNPSEARIPAVATDPTRPGEPLEAKRGG